MKEYTITGEDFANMVKHFKQVRVCVEGRQAYVNVSHFLPAIERKVDENRG